MQQGPGESLRPTSSAVPEEAEFALAPKRRRWVAPVAIVAVLGGMGGSAVVLLERRAQARAGEAMGDLSACLFGEAGPGEGKPRAAFRKKQLAAVGRTDDAKKKPWLARCGELADEVRSRAIDAGLGAAGKQDVGYWADQLSKGLKRSDAPLADLGEPIDALYERAAVSGLSIAARKGADVAPQGITVLDGFGTASPFGEAPFSLNALALEPLRGEVPRAYISDARMPAAICELGPTATRCRTIPADLVRSKPASLLGSSDAAAAPLFFLGQRGEGGIVRAGTARDIGGIASYGGYASAEGGAFVLGYVESEGKAYFVSSLPKGGATSRVEVKTREGDAFFDSAQLAWDELVLRGVSKDGRRHLYSRHVDHETGALGALVDVGPLVDAGEGITGVRGADLTHGCRSGDVIAVYDEERDRDFLTFRVDGRWSEPVATGHVFGPSVACSGASLATVSVSGRSFMPEVFDTRCTPAGCITTRLTVQEIAPKVLAPRDGLVVAAPIGDATLVVWAASTGGGIRMRVGRLSELGSKPEIVVADDGIVDEAEVDEMRLVPSGDHAVLMLHTAKGVRALRIDATGAASPEPIEWR